MICEFFQAFTSLYGLDLLWRHLLRPRIDFRLISQGTGLPRVPAPRWRSSVDWEDALANKGATARSPYSLPRMDHHHVQQQRICLVPGPQGPARRADPQSSADQHRLHFCLRRPLRGQLLRRHPRVRPGGPDIPMSGRRSRKRCPQPPRDTCPDLPCVPPVVASRPGQLGSSTGHPAERCTGGSFWAVDYAAP
jgi:hypothetical protein